MAVIVLGNKIVIDWLAFDTFLLFPNQRQLKRDGSAVEIGDKALDLLITLTEHPGQVFSKAELADRVWRRTWVEDVTIRVTVGMLRKLLGLTPEGDDYIVNVFGQGYSFSSAVHIERWPKSTTQAVLADHVRILDATRAPPLLKPVIGRKKDIERINSLLDRHRLVTIVGPGGIGKTTVAISAASQLVEFDGRCSFVDFGPIQDFEIVPGRIAAAITTEQLTTDPLDFVLNHLTTKPQLLILDNCEHLAEPVARIADDILRAAPDVKIIATSREPLRIDGEFVHRLDGLAYPSDSLRIDAKKALTFSAVQLFVERSRAAHPEFELTDILAPAVAEICLRLDGIALAIQLAASRVPTLGVLGVASRLGDRFRLFANGQRSALPRHRTLEAAFDWSFDLLTPSEKALFTRISVFCSTFTIDAVVEIAGRETINEVDAATTLANLVDKSLVVFAGEESHPSYRLLETVRIFARARLEAANEDTEVSERHVRRVISQCRDFQSSLSSSDVVSASGLARERLDDLRSALAWASKSSDRSLYRDLVYSAIPILTHLGLTNELGTWIGQVLKTTAEPHDRLALSIGLGKAVHLLQSDTVTQTQLYNDAYELAKELGDISAALQALWGLVTTSLAVRSPRRVLSAARHFYDFAIVNDRVSDSLVAECLMAYGLNGLGAWSVAKDHFQKVLAHYTSIKSMADTQRYLFNHRVLALCGLAGAQWQSARIDEAFDTADLAVREAGDHVPSLFFALSNFVCPIALDRSDRSAAARYIDDIYRYCGHQAHWRQWADALSDILAVRADRSPEALDRLDGLLRKESHHLPGRHLWYRLQLIRGHSEFGDRKRANLLMSDLLDELRGREEYWLLPQIISVKGAIDIHLDPVNVDANFYDTFKLARRQKALISELEIVPGRLLNLKRMPSKRVEVWIGNARDASANDPGVLATDSWSSILVAPPRFAYFS